MDTTEAAERPWALLDEGDPVKAGDEVRQDLHGVTRPGVVAHVDEEGNPWTAEGILIGWRDLGTWYVRRPAQELSTEAAELARIILADSEDEHPADLYTLNVREARTLARAALAADRAEKLADRLEDDAAYEASQGDHWDAASLHVEALNIRLALKGDDA